MKLFGRSKEDILQRSAISTVLVIIVLAVLQTYSPLDVSTSFYPDRQYDLSKDSTYSNNSKHTTSLFKANLNVSKGSLQNHLRENQVATTLKNKTVFTNNRQMHVITTKFLISSRKQKISHIGFLKVYKAGSTTLARILFRFGLRNNLTFVLPKKGYQFIKARSQKSAMPVRHGNHYDILACHSIYSREFFGSVLPEDSVNIGVIREPSERMISAAYYYRDEGEKEYLLKVPKLNFIHNLIKRPDLYETKPFSCTKNSMGRVFGFSPSITINDTEKIEEHLNLLKKDFKHVLIFERFDESVIFLKRNLNWDLADVVYLQQNSHTHQPVVLSPSEHKKLKSTCFLDYAVYKEFYEIFDKKIADEGLDFIKEVEHFRSVLRLVKDLCEQILFKPALRSLRISKSAWNEYFNATKQECHYMQMKSLEFLDYLKRRHHEMNTELDIM